MRFTAAQTGRLRDHLDWHYRQNRSEKDVSRKVTHRRWYYTLTDWIEFEEIADLEERAKSQFFEKENEEEEQKSQEAAKEKEFQSVRATADVVGESCEICQEAFEMYWEEEEEEWHLKNAIRVEDKTYHPSCYEDYKNTSSFLDVTPSPSRLLAEHPLTAFVKREAEEEEEAAASCPAPVKQEVEAEAVVKREEDEVLPEEESAAPPSAAS
uniref:pre-mRNA cleavage complex 2 protein Pcf11-like n=1 Tax=Centroberyx gerrardi TaxID=166262 RepID=UPI003AAEEB5D